MGRHVYIVHNLSVCILFQLVNSLNKSLRVHVEKQRATNEPLREVNNTRIVYIYVCFLSSQSVTLCYSALWITKHSIEENMMEGTV
jgi:hypothetical protein